MNSANNGQGITAVWTGTEMIVWGGLDDNSLFHYDGGRYDPELDLWHPTGTMNVPAARGLHAAAWTGSEMIIWGGSGWGGSFAPGASYDPATDSWRAVSTVDAPFTAEVSVWTGTEAIFWGGDSLGGRYNPTTDSWSVMTTINAPSAGPGYSVVWTGSEMIAFGGIGTDTVARRYRPATDTWTDATTVNAPGARDHHAAVWTGTEMIIWGGFINDGTTPTGGRYNPVTDHWTPTNVADSPITRMWPVGVWTGTEMLVWGGNDWLFLGDLGDGARYNPATDSWTTINLARSADAPHHPGRLDRQRAAALGRRQRPQRGALRPRDRRLASDDAGECASGAHRRALVDGLDRRRDDHLGGHHRDPAGEPLLRGPSGGRPVLRRLRERRRLRMVSGRALTPRSV